MKRRSLVFSGPHKVEVREEDMPSFGDDEVLVETKVSAISPGTELLIFRGQAPGDLAADESIPVLSGALTYPLKYGYASVGEAVEVGAGVEAAWKGRLVFAFNPHESLFVAKPENLLPLPQEVEVEEAAFFPNMESAVNFVMDGHPLLGERVAVFGQGIVGLLTTALLARHPLACLLTLDRYALRRQASLDERAHHSLDPGAEGVVEEARALLGGEGETAGADLAFELSGAPRALDQAIALTGYGGRVVIGSWYGDKRADLDLGGRFHRSRIRLVSSQVSTLAPELRGRWSKTRRYEVVWDTLGQIEPGRFVTHRFPLERAAEAYRLLDEQPEQAIQVLLTYES